jgi:uncharacterized membrane protein HdeD (DUF308 family)
MDVLVGSLSRHWWLYLLEGVLSIVLGILALAWPGHALAVTILFFGLLLLLNGIIQVFAAVGAAGVQQPWGGRLAGGIFGIIGGLAILRWPGATALVVLYLVALWAIVTGVIELVGAFAQRAVLPHAWLLALTGAISLLFGIAMFAWPHAGILTLVYLVGIFAIVFGISTCAVAFRLRALPARAGGPAAPPGAVPSA